MTLRHRLAAGALAALAVLTTACTAGGPSGDSSGSEAASAEAGGQGTAEGAGSLEQARRSGLADGLGLGGAAGNTASAADPAPAADRKVISTGNVALRAADVGEARFEVQEVVDRFGGEVAEAETATDDDGEVERCRLVIRVPVASFHQAVEELSSAARLVSASTTSEDVTTRVIDVDIRVRVQRRSIRRIELLLDRAESIRDIVSIEAQLSRRQAALASLEKQQDHLADQTAMATVTVSLERTPEKRSVTKADTDDAGFLAGLSAGWNGLVRAAVAGATVVGALLPFAGAALLLALPVYPLLTRVRRRTVAPE